jgi:DNA modification methylase
MLDLDVIYNEDCIVGLSKLPDGCIDLTVTSPPYDNLRKYNGYTFDFEGIAKQLYRVTKPGGVVVWVVGDATVNGSETGASFSQALYFKDVCGFNLHDTMIYAKSSQPRQNSVRYEQQFEFMFVFAKGYPNTRNILREPSINAGKTVKRTCRDGGKDELVSSLSIVSDTKPRSNIWSYGSKRNPTGHPAIFPEPLAQDHIVSWSNEGDLVLDPFMGSGTTAKAAVQLNRHYIGFEISTEYCSIAEARIATVQSQLSLIA